MIYCSQTQGISLLGGGRAIWVELDESHMWLDPRSDGVNLQDEWGWCLHALCLGKDPASSWRTFPHQRTVSRCHSQPWVLLPIDPLASPQHSLDFPPDETKVVFSHTNS